MTNKRKVIIMTGLDHNPIFSHVKEREAVATGPAILAPGAAVLLHVFYDAGPEGVIGTTYRTTESGAWRQSAFLGTKQIQAGAKQDSTIGLLNVAKTILESVSNGSWRLKIDEPKEISPLDSGAWWGSTGKRVTSAGGVSIEAFAQGIGNQDGVLNELVEHDGLMIPQICWGLPMSEQNQEWFQSAAYQKVYDSSHMVDVGRSFYRGVIIGATTRLARQKDRNFNPTGKTASNRQISQLWQDFSMVAGMLTTTLNRPEATKETLEGEFKLWHNVAGLFTVHVMYGSQALSAARTIWGADEGTQHASEVLSRWCNRYIVDKIAPSMDDLQDFATTLDELGNQKYPGGERVQELATRWASSHVEGFKSCKKVVGKYLELLNAPTTNGEKQTTESWAYGDALNPAVVRTIHKDYIPVIDLTRSSPIIVTEEEISNKIRIDVQDVVRGRRR